MAGEAIRSHQLPSTFPIGASSVYNSKVHPELINYPPTALTPEELKQLEDNLWQSADTLRANSDLKSSEYSTPVMGLIFLKFADNKYRQYEATPLLMRVIRKQIFAKSS
jgi:hypothetical protein